MCPYVRYSKKQGRLVKAHDCELQEREVYDNERRSVIQYTCHVCGESLYSDPIEDMGLYDLLVYKCRNGHHRDVKLRKD